MHGGYKKKTKVMKDTSKVDNTTFMKQTIKNMENHLNRVEPFEDKEDLDMYIHYLKHQLNFLKSLIKITMI